MFQLDDNFLKEVGLDSLPDDQKQAFLQHIYEQLELAVGTKLSEGMSEQQMSEFEAFIDVTSAPDETTRAAADDKVRQWFDKNLPDYQSRPDFIQLAKAAPADVADIVILSEYGSLKWLEINRPDYRQVVAAELDNIKKEIIANRDSILGAAA